MRKNIAKVIEAFKAGKAAQGDSKRTCWTDGNNVYSYSMLIAQRLPDGNYAVIAREYGPSMTTKNQIHAVTHALTAPFIVHSDSINTWDFKFNSSY